MKPNQLPAMLAIVMLASCGIGGGNKTSQGVTGEPTPSVPVQAAKMALSIIIPQALADEAPTGTTYTVKVSGKAAMTKEIPVGKTSVTIEGLDAGDYTIEVIAKVGADTVASGTATTTLTKATASIQVPVKYIKTSLLVEPVITSESVTVDNLSGKYTATAKMSGCIRNTFTGSFGATNADATIQVKDQKAKITLELFPKTIIEINGDISVASGATTVTGTYSASTDPDSLGNLSDEIARIRLAIDLATPIGQTPVYPEPVKEVPNAGAFSSGVASIQKIATNGGGNIFLAAALKGDCETSVYVTGFRISK